MSRIKDLEIRGIRNFGDQSSKARIHFSRPLTLILGPNGTGKTTIIEALKFITSGEHPPDSERGKSFVHEPKLTLNHTVRGQVKAKIVDKTGQELIFTRIMQVTRQKNNTLKFQALDNTITRIDEETNEKIQLPNRCGDIDREMLNAMGVSKPILNYVVFCHQEESNWPLEDGKKLKDKFDEIFDSSKYNKAMDSATKLLKDLQIELKEIRAHEEGLKKMVDEVESQEEKLKDCERREQEAKNRITEINESIKPIHEKINKIGQVKENYAKIDEKLRKVETDYKLTNNYIESIKKHIKQIHRGSKEELIVKMETYDQNLTQKVTTKRNYEDNLEDIEKTENSLLKKLADTRVQLGSLTQKQIAFNEKVARRNKLLTKSLKTWEIPQTDPTFTEEDVANCIDQIKEKFEEFSISMKAKLRENEQEEKHVQREVDTRRTERTAIESEMSLKDKERKDIESEINSLRKKISDAGEAGNKLSSVESNLQSATKNYDAFVQSFDENSIKETLKNETIKKKELDSKLSQVDQEINSLHKQSSHQAELELHQNSLQEKEKNMLSLKNKHKDNLELLFDGKDIPGKKFKESIEKIQKSLSSEKSNLLNQIEEEQQNLTKLETTLKCKQNELSKMNSELKGFEEKVASECQDNDYDEMLLLQERKVKSLQDQRGIFANQTLIYEEFLKQLNKKSCCPLCDRNFSNSSEEKQLEQKLYSEIKKSPQSLMECEKKLKIEQARYDVLQQLKPVTEQIIEIEKNKLPKMRASIEKIKEDLEKSEENLANLRLTLAEPEKKLSIFKTIVGDMILLDNYINESDSLNEIIETKKHEMQKAGKIGDRSMQEAQNERQILKQELTTVENNIEKIQSNLQTGQEKIQKAREQKNKLNEEVIQIRQSMQAEKQLKDKVKDLYDRESFLDESLKSLRHKLVIAEEELSVKIEELNKLKQKNRDEQDKDINFKSKTATEVHELKSIQQEVHNYISNKIEENLKKIEEDVNKIKLECEQKKKEKLELEDRIRSLDEQCRSQETGKKELENNLELLIKQESAAEMNSEINKYKKLLEEMEFDNIKIEYRQLQEDKDKLEKEKIKIKGAQGELEKTISDFQKSLKQEKYRMARHNYKEKQLQLIVQDEAILNLKEYITILDRAMIQFHEERMNTVNKIIRKLWHLVYGGNDTSSIQIRVQTTEGIGDKKRSYNYKLVQVKRSTEMDMKGKCSAGQKVLASIIIRMALAETFCNDCAILALDEPTTNLDEENASNLAVTLSKVIQLRAHHQKNFQLIVISHDEKFISQLSNLSGKQMFHELYRNIDGYSLIRRRDMSDYVKNSSQSTSNNNYEDDSDEVDEEESSIRNSKKRVLCIEDSPPSSRATKRRAYL